MVAKSWDVMECLGARMGHLAAKLVPLFATPGRWGEQAPDQRLARRGNCQDSYCVGWANRICQNRYFRGQHPESRLRPRDPNVAHLNHLENRGRGHCDLPTGFRDLAGASGDSNHDAIDLRDARDGHGGRSRADRGRRFDYVQCGDGCASDSTSMTDDTRSDAASRSPYQAMNLHGSRFQR